MYFASTSLRAALPRAQPLPQQQELPAHGPDHTLHGLSKLPEPPKPTLQEQQQYEKDLQDKQKYGKYGKYGPRGEDSRQPDAGGEDDDVGARHRVRDRLGTKRRRDLAFEGCADGPCAFNSAGCDSDRGQIEP